MTRPEPGTDHNTDYRVFEAEESCPCVCPEDDISAWAEWDDDHPWGEGVSGWEGRICHRTVVGTFCEECSHEQGDWFPHTPICLDCEYALEDDGTCQCEPLEEWLEEARKSVSTEEHRKATKNLPASFEF